MANQTKSTQSLPPEATGIHEVLDAGRARLLEARIRPSGGKKDSIVSIIGRHDSIPRALVRDPDASDGCVRAWLELATYAPTPFPGMRTLGERLGGADGAVRKTDELFLLGWCAKCVMRDGRGATVGTLYSLFPRRLSPCEMAILGIDWTEFVVRLAQPSHAKKDGKSRLRKRALQLIETYPELFRGVFGIPDSGIPDLGNQYERTKEVEGLIGLEDFIEKTGGVAAAKKNEPAARSFVAEFGFSFSKSIEKYITEDEAVDVCKIHRLDATQARRVMGELAAEALRGFDRDAVSALHHLARSSVGTGKDPIAHTAAGDQHLGSWA